MIAVGNDIYEGDEGKDKKKVKENHKLMFRKHRTRFS